MEVIPSVSITNSTADTLQAGTETLSRVAEADTTLSVVWLGVFAFVAIICTVVMTRCVDRYDSIIYATMGGFFYAFLALFLLTPFDWAYVTETVTVTALHDTDWAASNDTFRDNPHFASQITKETVTNMVLPHDSDLNMIAGVFAGIMSIYSFFYIMLCMSSLGPGRRKM